MSARASEGEEDDGKRETVAKGRRWRHRWTLGAGLSGSCTDDPQAARWHPSLLGRSSLPERCSIVYNDLTRRLFRGK